ncbi:M15 family metallopeptidase [Actinotalea sp. K2]|uniref:M15 family metallopeptidase n=1 Tax=Actinotalea sp. K2 TaxID=2939438 RepID=UPI002016E800|nr:D-alanyl-D-alanine carboxypeptidase family protein [Actinotalea sp. K2]MCL3860703.1 D-alanyl-D-alanine carboxypeptidase family protein [Actinotalea sp. K2]
MVLPATNLSSAVAVAETTLTVARHSTVPTRAEVAAAQSARRAAEARATALVEVDEALSVARTALDSARDVLPAALPGVDQALLAEYEEAVSDLTVTVRNGPGALATAPAAHGSTVPVSQAEPGTPAPEAPAVVAEDEESADQPQTSLDTLPDEPTTTPLAEIDASRRVAAAAHDLLQLAEEVQRANEVALERLVSTEAVADLAVTVSAEFKESVVELSPLEDDERSVSVVRVQVLDPSADPYPNGQIPLEALCSLSFAPDFLLRCDAAAALEDLNVAYRTHFGSDLQVVSAYRTYEQQVHLKQTRGWLAARPGTSTHGRGLAVDLAGIGGLGQFDTPGYLWLRENAPSYGWHHPELMRPGGGGPPEPWHWEFGTV